MRFLNWEGSSKEAVPPVSLGTADSSVAQGSTWSSAFRSACWGGFVHAMRAGHPGLTVPYFTTGPHLCPWRGPEPLEESFTCGGSLALGSPLQDPYAQWPNSIGWYHLLKPPGLQPNGLTQSPLLCFKC